jgi:hypothetical protein
MLHFFNIQVTYVCMYACMHAYRHTLAKHACYILSMSKKPMYVRIHVNIYARSPISQVHVCRIESRVPICVCMYICMNKSTCICTLTNFWGACLQDKSLVCPLADSNPSFPVTIEKTKHPGYYVCLPFICTHMYSYVRENKTFRVSMNVYHSYVCTCIHMYGKTKILGLLGMAAKTISGISSCMWTQASM